MSGTQKFGYAVSTDNVSTEYYSAAADASWHVNSCRWASNDLDSWLDGVAGVVDGVGEVGTLSQSAAYVAANGAFSIGAHPESILFADVDVGEVLMYNSALSTANRQAVEAYLNSRWGVY